MTTTDGTPIWFELTTTDQDRAQTFYQAVVGWKVATVPGEALGGYRVANAPDGQGVAGLMNPPPGIDSNPGWTTYFHADDPDAKAEAVKVAGGMVHPLSQEPAAYGGHAQLYRRAPTDAG